jgi:hypothetical protein
MAITNGLCSLSDVKGALRIADSMDDTRIEMAIEAASRLIEKECQRTFTQDANASARIYVASHSFLTLTDDISTTSGLIVKTDSAATGTFDQTWTSSDYQLEPLNGRIQGEAWPYTQIRAIRSLYFPRDGGQALVQVTARWGWASIPTAIKLATILQAEALFKAYDTPFGATAIADTGIMSLRALHPSAVALIKPYRKEAVLVA